MRFRIAGGLLAFPWKNREDSVPLPRLRVTGPIGNEGR